MSEYRHGAHTVFRIHLHIVWVTKYRKAAMTGEVGIRCRELIREICATNDCTIMKGHVSKDHIHLFVWSSAKTCRLETGATVKGQNQLQDDARVSALGEKVLGTTLMGAWLLLRIERQRHRRSYQRIHRQPKSRRRRGLQS